MSSTRSSASSVHAHDLRCVARGLLPPALVFLVLLVLLGAVSTSAIPDISIFSSSYTHDQLKFRFWAEPMTYPVVLSSLAFGMTVAFVAFRFLMIPMQETMYLSLPLTRRRLYLNRVLVSLVAMLLVILIALGVSLVLNLAALGGIEGESRQFCYIVFGLFLCALVGFSIMLAAILLAGTQVEAVLFALALLFAVSVCCWTAGELMKSLLVGNTAGEFLIGTDTLVDDSLLMRYSTCNPLLFFVAAASANQAFSVEPPIYVPAMPSWSLLVAWAVLVALLLVLCGVLFERRKGERAGITGLCAPMTFVFSLVCGLLVFGACFSALASVSAAAGIVVGVAAFALVSLLFLRGPLRGATSLGRSCAILGTETAVVLVLVAAIASGGLGWSARVPEADQVKSVEVSYTGAPEYYAGAFDAASTSENTSYASGTYTFRDKRSIAAVIAAHGELVAAGGEALATDADDFSKTVVPYDMKITYTLADGTKMARYYDRAELGTLASLLSLDDCSQLRALRAAIAGGKRGKLSKRAFARAESSNAAQAFKSGTLYLSDAAFSGPMAVNMADSARSELLEALADDLEAQDAADRYYPGGKCRGILMFTLNGSSDAESFSFQMGNTVVYLTDEFTHTLKWMRQKGLASALAAPADALVEMRIVKYDPYASITSGAMEPVTPYFTAYCSTTPDAFVSKRDYGKPLTVNGKGKRAQLAKLARDAYYLNGGGYLVSAKVRGTQSYAYLFIPAKDAPKWLVRQAGE